MNRCPHDALMCPRRAFWSDLSSNRARGLEGRIAAEKSVSRPSLSGLGATRPRAAARPIVATIP